jgi:hypothetical protein
VIHRVQELIRNLRDAVGHAVAQPLADAAQGKGFVSG